MIAAGSWFGALAAGLITTGRWTELHRNPRLLAQVVEPLLQRQSGVLAMQLAPGGVIRLQVPPSPVAPIGLNLLRAATSYHRPGGPPLP